MEISISWNTQQTTEKVVKDVASNESSFWEAVGKQLLEIPIPTTVDIESPAGNVRLKVRQRGTYTKNGTSVTSIFFSYCIIVSLGNGFLKLFHPFFLRNMTAKTKPFIYGYALKFVSNQSNWSHNH